MLIGIILIDGKLIEVEIDKYVDYDKEITLYKDGEEIGVFNKNNIAGFYIQREEEDWDD